MEYLISGSRGIDPQRDKILEISEVVSSTRIKILDFSVP
jgi:hypothetical protein